MRIRDCFKILYLLAGLLFISCSGSHQVISEQKTDDIKIDGNSSDWKQLTSMKGENISFGFCNDADNLYLVMITNDRTKVMNILRGGLKVWIDPGKSDDKIGIKYPDQPDPAEMMLQMKNHGRPEMGDQPPGDMNDSKELDPGMIMFLSTQKDLYIINEGGKVLKSFPVNGNSYQASLKADRNSLCYEIKIPFGGLPNLHFTKKNDTENKIKVQFVSGSLKSLEPMQRPEGMTEEGMPSGPPRGGGGHGGGFGGGPGGGNEDRMPGHQGRQSNTPIDYSFEVIIK
jgi:hypothetical protein